MTSWRATTYLGLVIACGVLILCQGILLPWQVVDWTRYLSYCAIALIASGMKVSLPSVTGTMSINFLFVLIGLSEFGLPGTLVMGCGGMLVQCVFHAKTPPKAIQVAFTIASVACSIESAYLVITAASRTETFEAPMRLLLASTAYFVANTLSVAGAIAATGGKRTFTVWRENYFWTFPNYLMGAAIAWGVSAVSQMSGWQTSLLILPVFYFVYRSHNLYVGRLEDGKKQADSERAHAIEVAALHRRAIETLALAIEAKDQTTHDHLERVETYAVEVGKELGLSDLELEALRAAALLHDVGKLAVPEYIISKPGKLTPQEFEKMKTHTVVGAEIVERIRFPYPVAPIVRSHHEKWNGLGYPDGLAGEDIPIGARILSAVDCLDALATDRQYRRALPLDEAIKVVRNESGISFDPRVVEVLSRRYVDLETKARRGEALGKVKLSTDIKIGRGEAPAAGFEQTARSVHAEVVSEGATGSRRGSDLLSLHDSIAKAASQARDLDAMIHEIGCVTEADQMHAVLLRSLRLILPYEVMVLYRLHGNVLLPEAVDGDEYLQFAFLEIPLGMGLSGWVGENCKSIINGNPSVEPGYLNDPMKFSALRSALAVPIEGRGGVVGVLSLYRKSSDAFSSEELRLMLLLAAAVARITESSPQRNSVAAIRDVVG